MKAAVCSLNSQYIHSSLAPWCLAAGAQAYCAYPVSVAVIEGTVNETDEALLERLLSHDAALLAFCCYIWNIRTVKRLVCAYAAQRPDVRILLGGPEVSFCAQELMEALPQVDFIQTGEGERAFALLLDALYEGRSPGGVPGLWRRQENGEITGEPGVCVTQEPPSPYTPAYFTALNGRIAYLETSRGCPFSCAFCLSGREDGVRFFSLERAKRELLLLANAGTRTVKLVDRTFNCDRERAYVLFDFIIRSARGGEIPPGVCFHFEVAADLFDDRTLRLLACAPSGLIQMEAGLQSFQARTLEAVSRKTDIRRLCGNLRRLIAPRNIHVHIDLIAGLPYEGLTQFADSFDRAYVLRPDTLQLGFLKLLHGSRLRRDARQYDYAYSPHPPYELQRSAWLSEDEKRVLHETEDALDRLYNSGRFRRTLTYLLRTTGSGPFDLLRGFGAYAAERGTQRMALDDYAALIWTYFSTMPRVEAEWLRDVMVCDLLSTRRGGWLPDCLRSKDPRRARLRRTAAARPGRAKTQAVAAELLYAGRERAVCVEYGRPDPVTGRYPLHFLPV